jgi:hypothetical protein
MGMLIPIINTNNNNCHEAPCIVPPRRGKSLTPCTGGATMTVRYVLYMHKSLHTTIIGRGGKSVRNHKSIIIGGAFNPFCGYDIGLSDNSVHMYVCSCYLNKNGIFRLASGQTRWPGPETDRDVELCHKKCQDGRTASRFVEATRHDCLSTFLILCDWNWDEYIYICMIIKTHQYCIVCTLKIYFPNGRSNFGCML